MQDFVISLLVFISIYLFYLFFVIIRKNSLEKFKSNMYIQYLVKVYKLDLKKINFKVLANIVVLINAFIIAITVFVVSYIPSTSTFYFILKMLIGFLILVPFQLLMYHIVGKLYQK